MFIIQYDLIQLHNGHYTVYTLDALETRSMLSLRLVSCLSGCFMSMRSGADPGVLPGEGAKGLVTLYGIGISDF